MARLLVNYILARHKYPMLVVRHRNKEQYLDALHESDVRVGKAPSLGATASLSQISPFLRFFKDWVATELQYLIAFATETKPYIWWYDGQRIAFRSEASAVLLSILEQNPNISIAELAAKAHISPTAVKQQLAQFQKKGYIEVSEKGRRVFAISSI